jgi:uncharacterized DUF497 family protein
VDIDFDPAKSGRNAAERSLPFDLAAEFEFETALIWLDERFAYPEDRWVAIGPIRERLHVLCFCETDTGIRVISFRKANAREVRRYDEARSDRPADG